jgi:hypothetical protein
VDDAASGSGVGVFLPAGLATFGYGYGSCGRRVIRACAYSLSGLATPSMVMTTAAALLSSGGGSDCSWQAAGDGDDLETSFVAKHHAGLKSTRLTTLIQR